MTSALLGLLGSHTHTHTHRFKTELRLREWKFCDLDLADKLCYKLGPVFLHPQALLGAVLLALYRPTI